MPGNKHNPKMPVKITGNNRSVLTNLLGVPKMARGIHCCPNYFFIYTHT